jgi:hypothetical protein
MSSRQVRHHWRVPGHDFVTLACGRRVSQPPIPRALITVDGRLDRSTNAALGAAVVACLADHPQTWPG